MFMSSSYRCIRYPKLITRTCTSRTAHRVVRLPLHRHPWQSHYQHTTHYSQTCLDGRCRSCGCATHWRPDWIRPATRPEDRLSQIYDVWFALLIGTDMTTRYTRVDPITVLPPRSSALHPVGRFEFESAFGTRHPLGT